MIKAAFQGEKGAYSEIACKSYFGENVETLPSATFEDVFRKVKSGKADYGVVPIENSLYGSIYETYDLLLKYSMFIQGELNLQITHHLVAAHNYKLNDIKKIYSHPQALGQCSDFLNKLKNASVIHSYDTAGSALIILNGSEPYAAAVTSKEAAAIYGLKILKSGIQNNAENYTRFLVINRKQLKGEYKKPKTSLCFELKSMPGSLFKALGVFAFRDIDLLKIESRPIPHKPFEYRFYVDIAGNPEEKRINLAVKHLEELSLSIKKFGTYESGKTYKS